MIRLNCYIALWLTFNMGCSTTVNHYTATHLIFISDQSARQHITLTTNGECLDLITFGLNTLTVTSMISFQAEFLAFQSFTLAQLHLIIFFNFRWTSLPERGYWNFLWVQKNSTMNVMSSSLRIYGLILSKFNDPYGRAVFVDRFIRVAKKTNMMYILHIGAIVGLADRVWGNAG